MINENPCELSLLPIGQEMRARSKGLGNCKFHEIAKIVLLSQGHKVGHQLNHSSGSHELEVDAIE